MLTCYLFSAVEGQVLDHGQPIRQAHVRRRYHWTWGGKTYEEVTTTDDDGRFHFPIAKQRMLWGWILVHQPVISQDIIIEHGGQSYIGWKFTKMNYDDQGEWNGPMRLRFHLELPPSRHTTGYGNFERI